MIDGLRQDITGGVRGLIKRPGFAAASLITLALGIGATSAIFSVVKAVLITPLPYSQPERRVQLFSRWVSFDKTWLSSQEVADYRTQSRTLSAVAAWVGPVSRFACGTGAVAALRRSRCWRAVRITAPTNSVMPASMTASPTLKIQCQVAAPPIAITNSPGTKMPIPIAGSTWNRWRKPEGV